MPARTNARVLTDKIAGIFREEGYDGASLSLLASRTELGKASLYHHFPGGKSEMAAAVYERVSAAFTREVLAKLAGKEPPAERLRRMVEGLDRFYDGGKRACLIDVFSVGGPRAALSGKLKDAVDYWVAAIARTLVDAGMDRDTAMNRAEDAVIAIEGALVVARATGRTDGFVRTLDILPGRLLAD